MKANEFLTEASVTDWFGKEIGRLEQKDINSRIKRVLPSMISNIQQSVAEKVNKLQQDPSIGDSKKNSLLPKVVQQTVSSLLKTRFGKDDEEDLKTILSVAQSNPVGLADDESVRSAIQNVIVRVVKDPEFFKTDDDDDKKKKPEDDEDEQAADDQAVDDEDDEEADADQADDDSGDFVGDFKDGIKDFILTSPGELDVRDQDAVVKFIRHNIDKHEEGLGFTSEDEKDNLVDEIMADPDMPFNFKPSEAFRGLVYSPNGIKYTKDDSTANVAYVRASGDWSRWEIGPRSAWRYMEKVVDFDLVKSLETLSRQATGDLVPLSFRHDDVEGQENLYRVTTR